MNCRKLRLIVGLTGMLALPFVAQANGPANAADACIRAFVQTYLPKDRAVQLRKPTMSPGPFDVYAKRYTLELTARMARSGNQLVTARCTANADGEVIDLISAPADGVGELAVGKK